MIELGFLFFGAAIARSLYNSWMGGVEKEYKKDLEEYLKIREGVQCPKCGVGASLTEAEKDLTVFTCECGTVFEDTPTHSIILK